MSAPHRVCVVEYAQLEDKETSLSSGYLSYKTKHATRNQVAHIVTDVAHIVTDVAAAKPD